MRRHEDPSEVCRGGVSGGGSVQTDASAGNLIFLCGFRFEAETNKKHELEIEFVALKKVNELF